jgi:DNA-binding Lrp family transcriptional regulator
MSTKLYRSRRGAGQPAEAWLFVEVEAGANPVDLLDSLSREQVISWDAVREARYRIVLHLHAESEEALRREAQAMVERQEGIASVDFVPVAAVQLNDAAEERIREHDAALPEPPAGLLPERATAYLLLDILPERLSRVYAGLYVLDEVAELEATPGGDRVVAVIQTDDYAALRRVVNDRVRLLDGVQRVIEMIVVPREMM